MDDLIELAPAIAALRAELLAAVNEGWNQPMQFRMEPIQLTMQVTVTKEENGKIGWKILGFGASRR